MKGQKRGRKEIVVSKKKNNKFTWYLIIANIAVFLLVFSMPEALRDSVFGTFSFSFSNIAEVWRWFTSLFLHVSASHLFFNMLGLYFFGKILENEVPKNWFLSVYFIGGLLGNFAFGVTDSGLVAGASGCVFAVMGAAMLLNPVRKTHMYVIPLPLGIVAIIFIIAEVFVAYFEPALGNIAHVAHLAGLLTGGVFAFFHDWKRSIKGGIVLGICVLLLIFMGPIFGLITGIGALVLAVIDMVIGFVLYNLAAILSFIWV